MARFLVVLLIAAASIADIFGQPGDFGQGQGNPFGGPGGGAGGQFGGQGGQFGGQGGQFGGQGGPFGGPGGPGGPFGGPFGGFPGGPGGFPGGPGGFPGGPGGFPGGPGGFFPNFGQNQFQQPLILTCIGTNEATDQLKVTFRPEPGTAFPPQLQQRRELQRQNWRISAVYIPAASLGNISPPGTSSLVGQFFLGVTRYGRTAGSCAGLGGILQNEDTLAGNSDPFSNNPYMQAWRNQNAAGSIQDPIVISQGGNVYSGVIRDLSQADLCGRGLALCLDYLCQRPTTTCCTIAHDSAPATEQIGPVAPIGPISGSILAGGGLGSIGGSGISGGVFTSARASAGAGLITPSGGSPGGLF